MVSTKVFTSGNSQAVRIPKEFHIDYSDLYIKKIGSTIILFPQENQWENLERSLSEFSDDFMNEGRNQPVLQKREEF
ncbi:MAG: AbrB/MazE/SpoVT family DNA-binding domain-containing protein [Treponema sp.]|jgi:antitoxin VapB|nr:AbrB/MazE/SpoVT family DNA-binding domain-containing protein [Treponema sp.]